MSRISFVAAIVMVACSVTAVYAEDPDRDFSGSWVLDTANSDFWALYEKPAATLEVTLLAGRIQCSSPSPKGGTREWRYLLDGSESKGDVGGGETWNSAVKWEGAALLINTLVSGPRNYVVMDRWRMSRDHATLTVTRQVMHGAEQTEAVLVYRRTGQPKERETEVSVDIAPPSAPAAPRVLARKPEPATDLASGLSVPAGTHILLEFLNTVDTKHSRTGDRIYLKTAFPVMVNGRVVIPRGSAVTGSVTDSKEPKRGRGKGELFIRFDTLTLPNGVTRDFRSRMGSADSEAVGKVDQKEGKVTGERDKGDDARKVATGTGIGASVGGIAGAAAGHTGAGLGVGAAAGAAAGLASVLFKRGPDAVLPRGSTIEMILDRELQYTAQELR